MASSMARRCQVLSPLKQAIMPPSFASAKELAQFQGDPLVGEGLMELSLSSPKFPDCPPPISYSAVYFGIAAYYDEG